MKKLLVLLVLVGASVLGYFQWKGRDSNGAAATKWRTTKVSRGEILEGVQASGAVQPYLLVQVGTQVSGTIEKLYKDFNSRVRAGETIAVLDSRRLVAQVAQVQANLQRARADVDRVKAQLRQAERELERQRNLLAKDVATQADVDAAESNVDTLKAQVGVAEASVTQTEAQLEGDLINLRYATIVSPVDGVVVSRNVDVGQTVAASLSAPTLFVIANDLAKVQVQASVPEAEIGKIHEGQNARFNVDAHSDVTFTGVVSQLRLASTTVQNVVTYTVLIDAENPKGLLLPGMTANVTFEVARSASDTLRVPASALRWKPPEDQVAAVGSGAGGGGGHPRGPRGGGQHGDRPRTPPAFLYLARPDGLLDRVAVRTGISDGILTEVIPFRAERITEDTEIVTGVARPADEPALTNPFAPRFGGGRRGGGH